MSVGRRGVNLDGHSGAEQGVTGHHAGRTGTYPRPAVCGGWEVRMLTPGGLIWDSFLLQMLNPTDCG